MFQFAASGWTSSCAGPEPEHILSSLLSREERPLAPHGARWQVGIAAEELGDPKSLFIRSECWWQYRNALKCV